MPQQKPLSGISVITTASIQSDPQQVFVDFSLILLHSKPRQSATYFTDACSTASPSAEHHVGGSPRQGRRHSSRSLPILTNDSNFTPTSLSIPKTLKTSYLFTWVVHKWACKVAEEAMGMGAWEFHIYVDESAKFYSRKVFFRFSLPY